MQGEGMWHVIEEKKQQYKSVIKSTFVLSVLGKISDLDLKSPMLKPY